MDASSSNRGRYVPCRGERRREGIHLPDSRGLLVARLLLELLLRYKDPRVRVEHGREGGVGRMERISQKDLRSKKGKIYGIYLSKLQGMWGRTQKKEVEPAMQTGDATLFKVVCLWSLILLRPDSVQIITQGYIDVFVFQKHLELPQFCIIVEFLGIFIPLAKAADSFILPHPLPRITPFVPFFDEKIIDVVGR